MNFFKQKEKPSVINFELSNPFIVYPDPSDNAGLREVDIQRFKWSNFLKSRPNIWSEDWLWQSRRIEEEPRMIKKKFLEIVSPKTKATKKLKALIRAGVPPELRGSVWWACSGAYEKMQSAAPEESYKAVSARVGELEDTVIKQSIEKDLLRTFPERIYQINQDVLNSLRRLLLAYALRAPEIGYCQSMNYLAALILFHLPEEQAFWVLAALIEDILPPQYYTSSLIDSRVDQQVFQSCLAWKLPKVYKALKKTDTLVEPVICPWFMCLFINVLPLYAVCRIWDCMFLEGSNVIFRVALSLMKSKQKQVKECTDFIAVYGVLKAGDTRRGYSFRLESKMVDLGKGVAEFSDVSDAQFMISSVFGKKWLTSVSKAQIDELRVKYKKLIETANEEADARRRAMSLSREKSESAARIKKHAAEPELPTERSSVCNGQASAAAGSTETDSGGEAASSGLEASSDGADVASQTNPLSGMGTDTAASFPSTAGEGQKSRRSVKRSAFKDTKHSARSMMMLQMFDEHDISSLRELALQMDEGLGDHHEQFANDLNEGGEDQNDDVDFEHDVDHDDLDYHEEHDADEDDDDEPDSPDASTVSAAAAAGEEV